jgi:hypothetical protein
MPRKIRQIAQTQDRAAIHGQAGDIDALQHDAPGIGLHQTHDGIEAGRLARAVRTQQADHLAMPDLQAHIGKNDALVIAFGDGNDLETMLTLFLRRAVRAKGGCYIVHLRVLVLTVRAALCRTRVARRLPCASQSQIGRIIA